MSYSGPHLVEERVPAAGYPMLLKKQLKYRTDIGSRRSPMPYTLLSESSSGFWASADREGKLSAVLGANLEQMRAASYDRFWSKAQGQAANAVNIAEMNKSMLMIGARLRQAYDILRSAKSGHFGNMMAYLNLDRLGKRPDKYRSNDWLEYTFGWAPIIQDVGKSVEILQREFDSSRVRGNKSGSFDISDDEGDPGISPGDQSVARLGSCFLKVSTSGQVVATNPNVLLANQLGFVNPASVAWDLVPFSFVIDWFIPVNKFILSFTNDFGVEVRDPLRTWGAKTDLIRNVKTRQYDGRISVTEQTTSYAFSMDRETRIDRPALFSRAHIPDPSVWFAVTSASLLSQLIGR